MNLWEHKRQHHNIFQTGNHKQAIKTSEQKKNSSYIDVFFAEFPLTSTCSGDPNEQISACLLSVYHSTLSVPAVFVSPPSNICKNRSHWIISEFHIMSQKFQLKNKDHLEPPPSSSYEGIFKRPNRASLARRDGQIPPREDSVSIPHCLHGLLRHGPKASKNDDEKTNDSCRGVMLWHQPKQCTILTKIPQNYQAFALFVIPPKTR